MNTFTKPGWRRGARLAWLVVGLALYPALIGVLNSGSRVIWLEINGPQATPALLVRLLDSVSNVAVARPG